MCGYLFDVLLYTVSFLTAVKRRKRFERALFAICDNLYYFLDAREHTLRAILCSLLFTCRNRRDFKIKHKS